MRSRFRFKFISQTNSMESINHLRISPALINSSSAWASDVKQLRELFDSKYTGAVTTRTATLKGFQEDPMVHTVAFYSTSISSINSYGYSPFPLSQYLEWVEQLIINNPSKSNKPFIISITSGDALELNEMLVMIQALRSRIMDMDKECSRVGVEFNISCPNIADAPPPSYNFTSLTPLINVLAEHYWKDKTLTIGLKMPPYYYSKQFTDVIDCIANYSREIDGQSYNPISFLSCTNTLGSSVMFGQEILQEPSKAAPLFALPTIFGGLAGESIHALSLGNVYSFSQLLKKHTDPALCKIAIIGVGGVTTPDAVRRMHQAGAKVVACATLFGREGVSAFQLLSNPV